MAKGILGRKLGMTQIFDAAGNFPLFLNIFYWLLL